MRTEPCNYWVVFPLVTAEQLRPLSKDTGSAAADRATAEVGGRGSGAAAQMAVEREAACSGGGDASFEPESDSLLRWEETET